MNITIPKIPEKTLALPSVKTLLSGLCVAVLSRTAIATMSPLGLAFAATFSPNCAYIALLGLGAGILNSGASGLKYIFSYLIYYILSYVKKTNDRSSRAYFLATSIIISGGVSLLMQGGDIVSGVFVIAESLICAGVYLLFTNIGRKTPLAHIAEITLLGGVLSGLSGVTLPYINVTVSAFSAIFVAMCICYACQTPSAVLGCMVLGFVMNVSGEDAVFACGAFALSAALASILADMGRFALTVGFLCGITVSALYKGSLPGANIVDIFAPMILFVLLPQSVHCKIGGFINSRFDLTCEEREKESRLAKKLRTVASALSVLGIGVSTGQADMENARTISDTIQSRVCRDCSLFESCWKNDSKGTYDNICEIWRTMERDGFCDSSNIPARFRQSCIRSESLLCEFRHAYELAKQSALLSGEAGEDRSIMARQYKEISNVLELLSREIESGCDTCEDYEARLCVQVTVMSQPKSGNASCGDTVVHFKKDGSYFVILCDGMGSGEGAKSQSRLAAKLFEEFLTAGFEKESALNMINSALALRADRESFSTADILEINLESGIAEFLKVGSAQSLIKTKEGIEVISSKSLPVGILEQVDAEPQTRCVAPGDLILMISDGVGEAGSGILKNEWLKKVLMLENRKDQELGRIILSGARSRTKFSDDMTCCVIRIKRER